MLEFFRNLLPSNRTDEDGASAVEYGLLVAGIAALIVAVVFIFGGVIKDSFNKTCSTIQNNGTVGADCHAPTP
jgi:pilus assembly protein Flp/PilA